MKYKKLSGGGYFKIINRIVPLALKKLGYTDEEIADIKAYALGHGTLAGSPSIHHEALLDRGFDSDAIALIESELPNTFDIISVLFVTRE